MQIKLIEWEIFFFKMPETKQINEGMTAYSMSYNKVSVNIIYCINYDWSFC